MEKATIQLAHETTWEQLKRRSSLSGIPAWKLAEEQAFHLDDVKKRSQKS